MGVSLRFTIGRFQNINGSLPECPFVMTLVGKQSSTNHTYIPFQPKSRTYTRRHAKPGLFPYTYTVIYQPSKIVLSGQAEQSTNSMGTCWSPNQVEIPTMAVLLTKTQSEKSPLPLLINTAAPEACKKDCASSLRFDYRSEE